MNRVMVYDATIRARAPRALVRAVEDEARRRYTTPSEVIRQALVDALGMALDADQEDADDDNE